MYYLRHLIQSEGNQRRLRVSLSKPGNGNELQLVTVAPLGIYIPFGVMGKVDEKLDISLVQQYCIATGTLKGKYLKN